MNSLLEGLEAAAAAAAAADDAEARRARLLLEFDRVLEQIAGLCLSRRAAVAVRARLPYVALEPIELSWRLADELRPLGEAGRWPPLVDVSDALDVLETPPPLQLLGPDLVHVAGVAEALDALRDFLLASRALLPTWAAGAVELATFGALAGEIRRALDRDGRLLEGATPVLMRLRKAFRAQERAVRRSVDQALGEARRQGWLTADAPTLRGDRFCLPIRSGARRRLSGIVHDRSATGGTLYIEPAETVELHNELAEIRLEVAAEEARILFQLNRAVEQATPALREACRFLLLADEVRAGLLWSRRVRGRRPRLAPRGPFRVRQGRHPLLLRPQAGAAGSAAGTEGAVVPLDLELPPDRRVVVISGPNAGGKTVALKTVGLLVLLARCGWDVPAREDTELPLVRRLCVDLGDDQSIEMSLSSFSAHLGHLVRFLERSDPDTLVLCDEIGGGTDPHEGTALAYAVLERLARSGATVLASTHFGLLKAAVHDHPAMLNAAMDYDEATLRPLFTLRLGEPGASHAFDIAERCGLPADLLRRARGLVGEERFQLERLLGELGERARAVAETEAELGRQAARGRELQERLSRRLEDIGSEEARRLAEIRAEGESLLEEGRRTIERVVRDLRSDQAGRESVRSARDTLRGLADRLPAAPESPPARPPEPGQRVRIPHLGLTGRVEEVRGGKVIAHAGGMRLFLAVDAVEPLDEPAADGEAGPGPAPGGWRWHGADAATPHEIDLRGQRAEEAWDLLDRLLDRAIPAGLREVLVIHGVGTGRLREALRQRLAADGRVRSAEDAPLPRGGHGATVVRLSDG